MKTKFPRADALIVAREICHALKGVTTALIVAGSMRRRKEQVGDVEILYVPRFETPSVKEDLFTAAPPENLADGTLREMINLGIIIPRKNVRGSTTWGESNKLAMHVASGIPIDFFATRPKSWWNYLVCRTGGATTNMRIASAAIDKGWKWHPYGAGFSNQQGELVPVTSERDVFDLVDLPYLEPWERE